MKRVDTRAFAGAQDDRDPDHDADRDADRVAARMLRRRADAGAPTGERPLWAAEFFGLHRVALFRDATAARQGAVLDACAAGVLAEAWFIEQCGIALCAKMVLLAESVAARQLFALVGADEATHAAWLEPWVRDADARPDAFNRFIGDLVEGGGAQPLAYLLQTVLEGFGIAHYGGLGEHCRDAALAQTFARMARDEALHHAAGLAAFEAARLSAVEREFLADAAHAFMQMIRIGPQAVVAALDSEIGMAGNAEAIFASLDTERTSAAKLVRLRALMTQPGMHWLVDDLADKGCFVPCSAAQCADVYRASRA